MNSNLSFFVSRVFALRVLVFTGALAPAKSFWWSQAGEWMRKVPGWILLIATWTCSWSLSLWRTAMY